MAIVYEFAGALVGILLLSRLVFFAAKRWPSSNAKILTVHAITLAIASTIAGFGLSTTGNWDPATGFKLYAIPQAIWLAIDLYRKKA
jgi:hypothetical protein